MGGKQSNVYSDHPNLMIWKKLFDIICLQEKDIAQLHHEFVCFPLDQHQTINVLKLINALNMENTSFLQNVLTALDTRNCNNINFGEFVSVLWNFCTLGIFAFDLYDDQCCGEVTPSAMTQVINDLHGSTGLNDDMLDLVHKLAHMPGVFTVTTFHDYCQKHPAIVTPIIAIQEKVRRTFMGEGFWRRLTKSREQLKCVITLSKLRILLLQHNDNRHRKKQTSKSYFKQLSGKLAQSMSRKIYAETTKVADDECPPTNEDSSLMSVE